MDVDARIQLFDLKTTYQFQTTPGIIDYNMPLYDVQTEPGSQSIASFPVYQGFEMPTKVNSIQVPFYTQRNQFWNIWSNALQPLSFLGQGDGTAGPYTFNLSYFPVIPGHIDMAGIISTGTNQDPPFSTSFNANVPVTSVFPRIYFTATDNNGQNVVVSDSGQFLSGNTSSDLYGLLIEPGKAPFGNSALSGGYNISTNTINYNTGVANFTFPTAIPSGNNIQAQCYFYQQGMPRGILYYNNCITVLPPPNIPYLVELTAYLSPAAFLNTGSAIPFAYMAEYIARGAARKILSDTGDAEQLMFYEPLFREQETLVWKRSQRQFTSTRTETIFSSTNGIGSYNNLGQGTT